MSGEIISLKKVIKKLKTFKVRLLLPMQKSWTDENEQTRQQIKELIRKRKEE